MISACRTGYTMASAVPELHQSSQSANQSSVDKRYHFRPSNEDSPPTAWLNF